MLARFVLIQITILLILGCSMLSKNELRSSFQLRDFKQETLPNGLQIIWIEDHSLPRMSLQMAVRAGSIYESDEEAGLHALTASMFGESTSKFSSEQLASELELLGIDFNSQGGSDFSVLSMSGLSSYAGKMIELFQHILLESKFDEKDIQRRKMNILAGLKKIQDNPSSVADVTFQRELYKGHPYSRLISGHPSTVIQFSSEDCLRISKLYFRPQRSLLVVSGQFDKVTMQLIRDTMAKWERWNDIETDLKFPKSNKKFDLVVTKSNLEQTQIRFGHLLVQRNHPDFLKIRVANMVLGGAFASRLNQKIRDDLGLTYSVGSSIDANLLGGSFTISTFTRHEKVSEVVKEIKNLYRDYVTNGITQDELIGAKSVMIGQFPMALETTDRLGFNLIGLWAYGISQDYLRTFQKTVSEFQLAEINRVIKQYFKPEDLSMVIYTDVSKTGNQVKSLGITNITEFSL